MPDYKRGVMRVAFQVMGVTAGRKDSNCEILLKEALPVSYTHLTLPTTPYV